MKPEGPAPTPLAKLLCTLCALFMAAWGMLAIVTQTHSGYARFKGPVTFVGDQAIAAGVVILCTALLPLVVWVPRRWIVRALLTWWVLMMVCIFVPLFTLG